MSQCQLNCPAQVTIHMQKSELTSRTQTIRNADLTENVGGLRIQLFLPPPHEGGSFLTKTFCLEITQSSILNR